MWRWRFTFQLYISYKLIYTYHRCLLISFPKCLGYRLSFSSRHFDSMQRKWPQKCLADLSLLRSQFRLQNRTNRAFPWSISEFKKTDAIALATWLITSTLEFGYRMCLIHWYALQVFHKSYMGLQVTQQLRQELKQHNATWLAETWRAKPMQHIQDSYSKTMYPSCASSCACTRYLSDFLQFKLENT